MTMVLFSVLITGLYGGAASVEGAGVGAAAPRCYRQAAVGSCAASSCAARASAAACCQAASRAGHLSTAAAAPLADTSPAGQSPPTTITPRRALRVQAAVTEDQEPAPPQSSRWIGVRMTPIPEPLAAHIGPAGVMVANVVKNSPADQAGIERYDVIVAFDGQRISDTQDLVMAVTGVEAGSAAAVELIRGGQKRTLAVTPAERPAAGQWEYKYEEPEENVIDRRLDLRGLRLRERPGDGWIIEQLGPLRELPDILEQLKQFDIDLDLKNLPQPPDVQVEIKPRGAAARMEVKIAIDENGNKTAIHRDAEGRFRVEKTDASGKSSSATYENEDAFRQGDPAAYEIYGRHTGRRGPTWFNVRPGRQQLQELQKRYQIEVKEKIERAAEQARKAQEKAQAALREAEKRVQEGARDVHEQTRELVKRLQREAGAAGESLAVQVAQDGSITVFVIRGGKLTTTHKFDSKEDFKAHEPELYEKVRNMLE